MLTRRDVIEEMLVDEVVHLTVKPRGPVRVSQELKPVRIDVEKVPVTPHPTTILENGRGLAIELTDIDLPSIEPEPDDYVLRTLRPVPFTLKGKWG